MLGMNLRRSAIFSKLHQEGVHSVDLISPAADLVLGPTEVYAVESITITVADLRDA
jgi:phage-related baseplate assembly protein